MNERYKELLLKLAKRLDLVALGVLAFLLILSGWLYLREEGYIIDQPPAPPPRTWQTKLPIEKAGNVDEATSKIVQNITSSIIKTSANINDDEVARRMIVNNMFDIKSVKEQAQVQKELNEGYNEAEKLFQGGKLNEALAKVNGILQMDPRHKPSLELKARLEEMLKGPAPAEATPAPP